MFPKKISKVDKQDLATKPSWANRIVSGEQPWLTGILFWVVIFVLYLPAAAAGRVGDFPGWVHFLRSVHFIDYLNRSESGIASMYQFTQVVTYCFFAMFGPNAWMWHLLFVTLHALNALLLFLFFRRLFVNSAVRNAGMVSFTGALLFCICPHVSEVVVWEPAFHYLFGVLLMLVVLHCAQQYLMTGATKYAWHGGVVFFLSTYSLEVFYLTPLFTITLALYYFFVLHAEKGKFVGAIKGLVLPQVLFFSLNLMLLRMRYHGSIAHIETSAVQLNVALFSKAAKYVFHILFFGRYFPEGLKKSIYHFFESAAGLSAFYGLFVLVIAYIGARFKKFTTGAKVGVLLLVWTVLAIGLIMPLWFPERGLVILDRYLYLPCGIIYVFLALLLCRMLPKYVFVGVMAVYVLINLRFTHKVNAYWQQSAHIVNNLVYHFPNDPTKKVLLLNLPECLDGVQMIGSRTEGEFGMMYDALMPEKLTNHVYDVEAYYLQSPGDGAHVMVTDDSTATVTLNQWGTWWLFYGFGATSYENEDFRVDMRDCGHYYVVVLKHAADQYVLLYQVGDQWKKVDWGKKGVEQW